MRLFLIFVSVPLIEIALFIQVGGVIGLLPTLAIVVVTAIIGTFLVRSQGMKAIGQLRQSFDELKDPTEPLAHGAMILFSGALLLTPGFFTDAVGFCLLVPGFRRSVINWARSRVNVERLEYGQRPSRAPGREPSDIIEGEWEEANSQTQDRKGPSGWTRD